MTGSAVPPLQTPDVERLIGTLRRKWIDPVIIFSTNHLPGAERRHRGVSRQVDSVVIVEDPIALRDGVATPNCERAALPTRAARSVVTRRRPDSAQMYVLE